MPFTELINISTVTPQDISAALDLAASAYPPRFETLLD